jgi:hypothetical protein
MEPLLQIHSLTFCLSHPNFSERSRTFQPSLIKEELCTTLHSLKRTMQRTVFVGCPSNKSHSSQFGLKAEETFQGAPESTNHQLVRLPPMKRVL